MKTALVIGTLALSMVGCATNFAKVQPLEVSKAIEVKDSDFDSKITYTGPQAMSETRRGLFVDDETVRLAAVKDKKTGQATAAVYVRILYSFDWRFYESVSFRDSSQADVKTVNRQVNGCTGIGCIYTEEMVFLVDIHQLRTGGDFEFRLNSKRGVENRISLPRSYIDGFLNGLPRDLFTRR